MPRNNRSGFTLIELMITIAVIAIVAAIALPSFKSTIENRKLIAAANELQADLMFARSSAIKRNRQVFVSFKNVGAANWCYGFNELAACDCQVAGDCQIESQQKIKNNSDIPSVILTEVVDNEGNDLDDIAYNQFRGSLVLNVLPDQTIDEILMEFGLNNKTAGINLTVSGNARSCSGDGLGGLSLC